MDDSNNIEEYQIPMAEGKQRLKLLRVMGYDAGDVIEDIQEHPDLYQDTWLVVSNRV